MKHLITLIAIVLATSVNAQTKLNIHPDLVKYLDKKLAPFYHGVASGDPTDSSIVLWTRLTKEITTEWNYLEWEVATDNKFKNIVKSGKEGVSKQDDYIAKPYVTGLSSNTQYYYRFKDGKKKSIVGQFKTLPKDASQLDIAFASCSNFEWGYFNNYRFMAEDTTIDLIVHLGDYIYEYGVGVYGDTTMNRLNVPRHEIKTLDDYRTRYSLYRLDKDLMKAHQMKAFVTTWDDHESANNSYDEGAQNHQEATEGSWSDRSKAARKAYYEWLPVHKEGQQPLYRSFSIGNLANLIILDTRLGGRTKQMSMDHEDFEDRERTILGAQQRDWFENNLRSDHQWKIVGNQVPFGPLYLPDSVKGIKYMDGWDGYPFDQNYMQQSMTDVENVVIVTGDFHRSFALENNTEASSDTTKNVSVEFVVTSITSANANEYVSMDESQKQTDTYLEYNPHMKYGNSSDHGFVILRIDNEKVIAEFVYATNIRTRKSDSFVEKSFKVESGRKRLIPIEK